MSDPGTPRGPYASSIEQFPVIRQSLLSDADNCMLSSSFSILHERGWSSTPAARGTVVHRCIAVSLQEMMASGARSVPGDYVIDKVLPHVIRQHDVELESSDGLGEDMVGIPLREIAQARISLKAWAANTTYTPESIAGVERRLTTLLAYPDTSTGELIYRTYTGKLDVLIIKDTDATVIDWKDTFGIPPASSISEEGYFQQRSYAKLVFDTYPRVQTVTLREFYVRYAAGTARDAKGNPIDPVREATIERNALPDLDAELNALVERFDRSHHAQKFKPTPGSHCSYCTRPTACPIFPQARMAGRVTSQEEAEVVAGQMVVARAIAKQAAASLRPWAEAHGDVDVKDAKRPRRYGPVVRRQTSKPTLEEIEEARRVGKPIESLYVTTEVVKFDVHSPEEEHPFARAARDEEERLLAAEKGQAR